MDEPEEWRDIPGHEGFYQASSLGRIKSLPRTVKSKGDSRQSRPGCILKQNPQDNGYLIVNLSTRGKRKTRTVHRLICEAFWGLNDDADAAHDNGNKIDNRAANLYWKTRSENILDQVRHGRHIYGSRTHCKNGHEYTPETTGRFPSYRGRYCLCCYANRRMKKRGL